MLVVWLVFSPFIGALIAYILGRRNEKARDCFAIVLTALELVLAVVLAFVHSGGTFLQVSGFLVTGLSFEVNGFKAAYAVITALMWAGTTLFAPEYFRHEKEGLERYWMFILLTLGATEGVMLSGDLMTTFIFFEILSFTSFTWVIHEQTKEAVKAGYTYLFIAVFGGLVLFMGLALLYYETGTLSYADLKAAVDACPDRGMILAAGICVLPLHVWLPKAHPVAPSPASALLSGILTKVGIYGILMITLHALVEDYVFGSIILIAGMITMLLGAVLGVFSVNLKRTLACSSMSQIGFILTGVGMLILLSAAGSEEGYAIALPGLLLQGRKKNKLKIAFALGALGISGVPLMNGYMSKTLLHEGIVEGIHLLEGISSYLKAAEWIFLVSGGLTFCYMLKLFICIFVEENKDPVLQQKYDMPGAYMNLTSTIAILGSSIFCLLLGQPLISTRLGAFMSGNSHILHFKAFTLTNLKGGAISLCIGGILYLVAVRGLLKKDGRYKDYWPKWLDLEDLVYRGIPARFIFALWCTVLRIVEMSTDTIIVLIRKTFMRETRVRNNSHRFGLAGVMAAEFSEAAKPIVTNFTFALLMTCLGIIVMLFAIVYFAVL